MIGIVLKYSCKFSERRWLDEVRRERSHNSINAAAVGHVKAQPVRVGNIGVS